MASPKRSIKDYLGDIEDYRRETRNKRHEFIDILVIALCGMLSGAEDWVSIARYGELKKDFFKQFLSLPNGIPSHDTFNRVFMLLDPERFTECFTNWIRSTLPILDAEQIAIDGKTLRRSRDGSKAAIHMVSAWSRQNQVVLGQLKTAAKSNEIKAIPELLETLALEGCLVTIDAMGCQKHIAKTIVQKKGDYLLAVKANQPKLLAELKEHFDHRLPKSYKRPAIDFAQTEESNRGRKEIRRCWVSASLSQFDVVNEWDEVKSIAMIESERTCKGKTSVERRYYICSAQGTATEILEAARGHWSIENSLHWVLDMAFREDECRVRKGHGAENLARLRHMALNLLKRDESIKIGVKNKRLSAGWDNDYLLHLVNML